MRRLAFLLVTILAVPLAARADDASHRAKAEEMMTLMHTEHSVQQISDNIMLQITAAADEVVGPSPTTEQRAKVEDFKKQAAQMVDAAVGWKAMKDMFIDVYVKTFTEEELDAIITFYKSPAGVALLEKTPGANAQFAQMGQARVTGLQTQLKSTYEDFEKSVSTPAAPSPLVNPPTPLAPVPPK